MGLRYGLERMKQLGLSQQEVRLIGGGARSPVWRQIVANIFNLPVVAPEIEEGPAFGAALQAMWCRTKSNISDLAHRQVVLDESTRKLPMVEKVPIYDELYELYHKTAQTLMESEVFPLHRCFIESEHK